MCHKQEILPLLLVSFFCLALASVVTLFVAFDGFVVDTMSGEIRLKFILLQFVFLQYILQYKQSVMRTNLKSRTAFLY